jgi:hypothetical protein
MIIHQIFDMSYREGNPDSDADRADWEQFYSHFDTYRAMGPDPFQRRKPNHLRPIEEQVPRAAFASINHKLSDRLSEQLPNGLPRHFVRHVERIHVNNLTRVLLYFGDARLPLGGLRLLWRRNHKHPKIP